MFHIFLNFIIAGFIVSISPQAAAFTWVQGNVIQIAGNISTSVTLANNPKAGDLVVCAVSFIDSTGTTTISSAKDSNNNSYTVSPHSPSAYSTYGEEFGFYLINAPANASKTITVTFAHSFESSFLYCDEFSGSGTVTLDTDTTGTGTGGIINTPSITPSGVGELAYAGCASNQSNNFENGPWTFAGGATGIQGYGLAGFVLSISTAIAPSFLLNGSYDWSCVSMLFKETVTKGFSWVQGNLGTYVTSGTTASVVLPSNPTAGDLVACNVSYWSSGGTTIVSAKDANNNNYTVSTHSPSTFDASVGQAFALYLLKAPANANKTITVAFANATSASALKCDEFSVRGGFAAFDQDQIGTGTSGSVTNTPSITPTVAGELLYAGCTVANSISQAVPPWSQFGGSIPPDGSDAAFIPSSSSTAIALQFNQGSGGWSCIAEAFKLVTPTGYPILQ